MFKKRVYVNASDIGKAALCPHMLSLGHQTTNKKVLSRTQLGTMRHDQLNKKLLGQDKRCFIASYALGADHAVTQQLRDWRDSVLAQSKGGRLFIWLYYLLSPLAISLFGKSRMFKRTSTSIVLWLARFAKAS